ncbi:gliding motility-associated C-terminal domain-containing protein [Fibrella sp. WM1]|uniref:gliding motility-associated C-terminal domain-containing protein n=1 Tax=Fibrella musci TaxID=3242485 RepID=UPI0035208EC8
MKKWLYVTVLLFPVLAQARHIIGGELTMRSLGKPGYFRVQMDQYWNEVYSNSQNNDATITLFIYQRRGPALIESITLPLLTSTPIIYANAACAQSQSLRTLKGTYYKDIQFDVTDYGDGDGYYMVWERCCRDNAITNLANATDIGMLFYLEFPAMQRSGTAFTNSSPVFGQPNGEYICINKPTAFAYTATDADGDQLRYSLVTPYQGYTTASEVYGRSTPRANYPLVTWGAGIAADRAISGNPALQINPNTGQLTVRANKAGYYLFSVQCDEFRNGQRIGSIRRDFVLPVVDCNLTPLPVPVIQAAGATTTELNICPGTSATLTADANPQWAYQWRLDGSNIDGANSPTLAVQKTGSYTVLRSLAGRCANDTLSQPFLVKQLPLPAVTADSVPTVCASHDALPLVGQPLSGTWTGPGVANNQFDPTQAGVGLHKLVYTAKGANGCLNTTTRWAEVSPPIALRGPQLYRIQRGSASQLTQTPSVASATVLWSPALYLDDPTSTTPLCSPVDSQTYTVRAEVLGGCTATASVTVVVVDRLYIPSAFSPNGDGQNDVWQLQNAESFPDCDIRVFNRWGELVYQCTGLPNEPWDGTYRQIPVEAGTYTYLIRTETDRPALRGSVTVLR